MPEPKGELEWRSAQGRGDIMKPETFSRIESKARKAGMRNPKAVAGKAYWNTARAKYRKSSRSAKRG